MLTDKQIGDLWNNYVQDETVYGFARALEEIVRKQMIEEFQSLTEDAFFRLLKDKHDLDADSTVSKTLKEFKNEH